MKLSNLNKIKGGLADHKSLKDVAKKHGISSDELRFQLDKGVKVELEHTSDRQVALEIAMDHLWEDPEYYDKLEKVEESNAGNYPGSATGGTRTMPKKVWVDDEDLEETNLDSNLPDDVPGELKKSNNTQPILKEPDDWLNPKVAKHRGPGA